MKLKKLLAETAKALSAKIKQCECFANIAEGTHSGYITMTAAANIAKSNLLLRQNSQGTVKVAMKGEMPIGTSCDCAEQGESLGVILAGVAEQTVLCVAASAVEAGDTLYGADNGKVSASAAANAYKIGVALNAAPIDGIVEVLPQGFGSLAYQTCAAGVYVWEAATATESMEMPSLKEGDIVVASLYAAGASEKSVIASIDSENKKITFKLDANGTANTTKVCWILMRNA